MNDVAVVLLRLARAVERGDISPAELVEVFHAEFYGRPYLRMPLAIRCPTKVPRSSRARLACLRKHYREKENTP